MKINKNVVFFSLIFLSCSMLIFSNPTGLSLIAVGYEDNGLYDTTISRTSLDNELFVQIYYLKSSDFFMNYFPNFETFVKDVLTERSVETGLSIPDFFDKYTDYNWRFDVDVESVYYTPNHPDWAENIFGLSPSPYYVDPNIKSLEMTESWIQSKNDEVFKEPDIIVYVTDYYFRGEVGGGHIQLSMWDYFNPLMWERVPEYVGSRTEDQSKSFLKFTVSHEIVHLFGAYDHYSYASGVNPSFVTDDVMGDGSWGNSLNVNEDPYLDSRVLDEIHWGFFDKERLYPVPVTISGKVLNNVGDVVPNANIYFDGLKKTATGYDGKYSFTLPDMSSSSTLGVVAVNHTPLTLSPRYWYGDTEFDFLIYKTGETPDEEPDEIPDDGLFQLSVTTIPSTDAVSFSLTKASDVGVHTYFTPKTFSLGSENYVISFSDAAVFNGQKYVFDAIVWNDVVFESKELSFSLDDDALFVGRYIIPESTDDYVFNGFTLSLMAVSLITSVSIFVVYKKIRK